MALVLKIPYVVHILLIISLFIIYKSKKEVSYC